MNDEGVEYTATMSWGGEVVQRFTGTRSALRAFVETYGANGGTLIAVGLQATTPTAARALYERLLEGEATEIPPATDGADFHVVVGSGWAKVEVAAEEPVGERWTRSVWPAIRAATAAGAEVTARIRATKKRAARGDRTGGTDVSHL